MPSTINTMQTDIQSINDHLKNQPQAECQLVNAVTARNLSGNSSYTRPQYYPSYTRPQYYPRANVRPGDRPNFNQNDRAQRQNNPVQYSQQYANVFHKVEKCGYCRNEVHSRNLCPARDKVCHNCHLLGHFSRMCRRSKRTQYGFGLTPVLNRGEHKKSYTPQVQLISGQCHNRTRCSIGNNC